MAVLGNLLLSIFVGAIIGFLIGCAIIGLMDLYDMYKTMKRDRGTTGKRGPVGRRSGIAALFRRR